MSLLVSSHRKSKKLYQCTVPELQPPARLRQTEKGFLESVCKILQTSAHDDNDVVLWSALQERYDRDMELECDADGWPVAYKYFSEKEDPCLIAFKPAMVKSVTRSRNVVPRQAMLVWAKLQPKYKEWLYFLLGVPVLLYSSLGYNEDESRWEQLFTKDDPEDITVYGADIKRSMLLYLQNGRSEEEMENCMDELKRFSGSADLAEYFRLALISGMTNGAGRTAVWTLMHSLVKLVEGLEVDDVVFPAATVIHVSSSSEHSFSIVRSPSGSSKGSESSKSARSEQKSQSCKSTSESPPQKCRKLDDKHQDATRKWKNRRGNCCVDMVALSYDTSSHVGNYLFLIEIHSPGQPWDGSIRKFCSEIIYVLQAQSQVFGLFFGKEEIRLFRGVRKLSGKIEIQQNAYSLCAGSLVSVKDFQKLIMDTFTCIVYAMNDIDV